MISEYKNGSVTFGNVMSFTIVVMGVFLSVFTSIREISILRIVTMIILGICYIFIGIYIYSLSAGNSLTWLRLTYLLSELILAMIIIYISKGAGISLLIILPIIGHSVILLAPRVMLGMNGFIALLYFIASRIFSSGWENVINGLPVFLAGQIFVIIFMQMYIEEENANNKIKQLIIELEAANKNLKNYSNQVEELTIVRERNRLAREIHDGLGHYLTVIHMQIQAAKAVMKNSPEKAIVLLTIAQKQSQEALIDVRKSVTALRDSEEARIPLSERINQLVHTTSTDKLHITSEIKGKAKSGSPHLELTIFRIIQEGIQNCIKHAQASKLKITLDYEEEGKLRLNIRDNGVGTEKINGGFGLIGMKERVQQLGGSLNYSGKIGEGFTIEVEVPI
jgi:signal transduction histidine kinase